MINFLRNIIVSRSSKMLSYAEFISLVLYHPIYGYYMRKRIKIGSEGDFITSSNVSDIYGRTIAKWYAAIVEEYGINPQICELGAGNGRFAKAFIDEWHEKYRQPLQYYILETSPYHRELQRKSLSFGETVKQIESFDEITPFSGLVFSNELFDALPVHVVEKKQGQLFEVMIGMEGNELVEKAVILQNEQLLSFLKKYQLTLNEGQRIEIPLEMERFLENIAKSLEKGLVVTVDYGYTTEEWMDISRRNGSLRGYYKHQLVKNVLERPGEMDITSHVHFDALIQKGEEVGLHFLSKQRQDEFLLSTGILNELTEHHDPNPFSQVSKRNRAIRSLIMPGSMSSFFHVIMQQKGYSFKVDDLFKCS
ncbi:SAM-dependent methyltransferase [Bacillus aquiflavi]|uniref:SAM-dependent methyltransferase n=1 Tax=Bacillus aquiflavi TaxID=2672567 RepID=A0A6B3VXC8_9BACI|nr:SAM-dependent methyltransferase [Bacillus aquiflavi]MBA4535810.1 SAM-dependent methyltransferase [Bacillus aquiflavi]NEY80186.1 SAM-dependent methyltransferase [Bacillus aquiflavi]UAC47237.1 SAM-dependent methyltransferase [Bacillus aquiflavi]